MLTPKLTLEKRHQLSVNAYLHACYQELLALKPGNVGVHAAGHDMTLDQFQTSARVSAGPLGEPGITLGHRIYSAVKATHDAVDCNTNLGIILLCAPLIQAFLEIQAGSDLRSTVTQVLDDCTVEDAQLCYQAIRLANPGGLGNSDVQDVHDVPDETLSQVMRIAAERDRIAFQYASGFADIFDFSIHHLAEFRRHFTSQDNWVITALYLELLAHYPDSHILRKHGSEQADEISEKAQQLKRDLLTQGPTDTVQTKLLQADMDFKQAGINPGTTADLVVATLFAEQLGRFLSGEEMEGSPNFLQGVVQPFFSTKTHLKEVEYGCN